MFEVKFCNENIDINKDVKDSKKRVNRQSKRLLNVFLKGIVFTVLSTILSNVLFNYLAPGTMPLFNIFLVNLSACGCYITVNEVHNSYKRYKNNHDRLKAESNLEEMLPVFAENNIITNVKELSNTVTLNKSCKIIEETNNYGISNIKEEIVDDTYYLFLSENSDLCGLLERNNTHTNNDESTQDRQFYILEEEDLKELKPKVAKVRRLVRVSDQNEK